MKLGQAMALGTHFENSNKMRKLMYPWMTGRLPLTIWCRALPTFQHISIIYLLCEDLTVTLVTVMQEKMIKLGFRLWISRQITLHTSVRTIM